MSPRSLLCLSAFTGLLAFNALAEAADYGRGELLYENHCMGCHESVVHVRELRKIRSLPALSAQVEHRAAGQGLRWSDEDVADVVLYLNRRFYKLQPPPLGG